MTDPADREGMFTLTAVRVQLPDLDPRLLAPHPDEMDDTGPFADHTEDEAPCTEHEVIECDQPGCCAPLREDVTEGA